MADDTLTGRRTRLRTASIVATLLIGFVAGLASGGLGIGGGVIIVPSLIYFIGLRQHQAHGTALAAVWVVALCSLYFYCRHGLVDWGVAAELAAVGVLGASIGTWICVKLNAAQLRRYFAIFLVIMAIKMLHDAHAHANTVHAAHTHLASHGLSLIAILFVGLLSGIVSGLLSVGGSIILVPSLVIVLGFGQRFAQGISLAVILPVAIAGGIAHYRKGNVDSVVAPLLAVGGIIGGLLGGLTAILKMQESTLKLIFAILMIVAGCLMTLKKPARECIESAAVEPTT